MMLEWFVADLALQARLLEEQHADGERHDWDSYPAKTRDGRAAG
jgi:hypothetical protein